MTKLRLILSLFSLALTATNRERPFRRRSAVAQPPAYDCDYCDYNSWTSWSSVKELPHGAFQLVPNVGFRPFTFGEGNVGSYAHQSFFFSYPFETRLLLTDCFCGGDRFLLHDDSFLGAVYDATRGCDLANLTCNFYSEDPQECAFNEGWCSSQWIKLATGYHNLTIEILTSPFLSGTGYILLQALNQEGIPSCEPFCYYGIQNGFE